MSSLPDATELTKAIKKAASKAVKAEKPVEVCFGKVTSASPLQILVDQKFTLGAAQLVLTRNVTDFTTNVTVSWNTENKSGGSGESSFASHNHAITGRIPSPPGSDILYLSLRLFHTASAWRAEEDRYPRCSAQPVYLRYFQVWSRPPYQNG